jgi:2-iminobutanoate/2-iminopropanoate deaminase
MIFFCKIMVKYREKTWNRNGHFTYSGIHDWHIMQQQLFREVIMSMMKTAVYTLTAATALFTGGCGVDEVTVHEIARQEALKAIEMRTTPTTPLKFGFGMPWEKEFSYAQGVKTGNTIFIAGQRAHGRTITTDGVPEFIMGDFEQQFRATLENMKAVLANYKATMDNIVFIQVFVDAEAGGNKAGDYNPVAAKLIKEYFPKGQQAMTIVEVTDLNGPQQLVESNAVAVVPE